MLGGGQYLIDNIGVIIYIQGGHYFIEGGHYFI
jgi:hypothetical protein